MSTPSDRRYTKSHEWVLVDADTATVGITDYAQGSLGDVVHVEMPETDESFDQSSEVAEIESVKAVSSIYAPITGTVTAVNESIEDEPERVNSDAYGDGWLFRMTVTDASELDGLLDADAYEAYLAEQD
jgi:glycine cleavage system H protein